MKQRDIKKYVPTLLPSGSWYRGAELAEVEWEGGERKIGQAVGTEDRIGRSWREVQAGGGPSEAFQEKQFILTLKRKLFSKKESPVRNSWR